MTDAEIFVARIVTEITGAPDCCEVLRTNDDNGVLLLLTIDKEHAGRVIGKAGITARAIRTLLNALGTKNRARYSLKIEVRP